MPGIRFAAAQAWPQPSHWEELGKGVSFLPGNSGYFAKSRVPGCFLLASWGLCRMILQAEHSHLTAVMGAPHQSVYSFVLYLNSPLVTSKDEYTTGKYPDLTESPFPEGSCSPGVHPHPKRSPSNSCSAGSHRSVLCFGA